MVLTSPTGKYVFVEVFEMFTTFEIGLLQDVMTLQSFRIRSKQKGVEDLKHI